MKTKWTYEKDAQRYLADIDGCAARVYREKYDLWNADVDGGNWTHWAWRFRTMAEAMRHAEAMVAHMKGVKR